MMRWLTTRVAETIGGAEPPPPMPAPRLPARLADPAITKDATAAALRATLAVQQAIVRLAEMGDVPPRSDAYATATKMEEHIRLLEVYRRHLLAHADGSF